MLSPSNSRARTHIASRRALLAITAVLVGGLGVPTAAQEQLQELHSNDPPGSDRFGESVSVDNKRAVIGAPLADGLTVNSGAAYLFEDQGAGWSQTKRLVTADGQPSDLFGQSVGIYGGRAVVGAPRHSSAGKSSGAAYIFTLTAVGWAQTAKLVPSDGADGDEFGASVSIFNKTIVVGAPKASGTSVPSIFAGAVYVFVLEQNSWVQKAKLQASDAQPFREFGRSVSLFQDSILIGSPSPGPLSQLPEAAYRFVEEASGWTEKQVLVPSDQNPGNYFGTSVSVFGAVAMIGAPHRQNPNGTRGAAYVFGDLGSSWGEIDILEPPKNSQARDFGDSVAVLNGRALVGAPFDAALGTNAGAAYAYISGPNGWLPAGKLTAENGGPGAFFGGAVGLALEAAVVGAFAENSAAPLGGAAYVFDPNTHSLVVDPEVLSISAGGTQFFQLDAGAELAGMPCLMLGTASGTTPGLVLDGNLLALNFDTYTELFVVAPNVPPLGNTLSALDVIGRSTATMFWPPNLPPGLLGRTLNHAYVIVDATGFIPFVTATSNSVKLEFKP